jgi:hypothetical protein
MANSHSTRQEREPASKSSNCLKHFYSVGVGLFITTIILVLPIQADEILPAFGGSGGAQFIQRCPSNEILVGLQLRGDDYVASLRAMCAQALGPTRAAKSDISGDSSFGGADKQSVFSSRDARATFHQLDCPADKPVIVGLEILSSGAATTLVSSIHQYCGLPSGSESGLSRYPAAVFDGVLAMKNNGPFQGSDPTVKSTLQRCPQGEVSVGINGRSGEALDALGLICDAPRVPVPGLALGRVKTDPTHPSDPKDVCSLAQRARARNSPAASSLEAQCNAEHPGLKLGRVKVTTSASNEPPSVCDAARTAAQRGSPAAPVLESQCKALVGPGGSSGDIPATDALLAAGGDILSKNALAAEFRAQQPEATRHGFDIGLGAIGTKAIWGPHFQRILETLPSTDQEGFKVAASFLLDWNRESTRIAIGQEAAAHISPIGNLIADETDRRYVLGIYVATAIFGPRDLNAQGNKSMGPGATGVRNALSPLGQKGFDAAASLLIP